MKVRIVYGNHGPSPVHMEDYFTLLEAGFRTNGFAVEFGRGPASGLLNVIFENFEDHEVERIQKVAGGDGTRIVIIATEYLTGGSFNAFEDEQEKSGRGPLGPRLLRALTPPLFYRRLPDAWKPIDDPYASAANWRRRFRNFERVLPLVNGIWCMSEYAVPGYREATGHENVDHMKLGFVSGMGGARSLPDEERAFDFFFSGTLTPYRKHILDRLSERGHEVVCCDMSTPNYIRDNYVSRARICLNLKQNSDWPYASVSRFHYHLINRSFLLTEDTEFGCELSPYVYRVPSRRIVEACGEALEAGGFQDRGERAFEAFRDETSFSDELGRLLALLN